MKNDVTPIPAIKQQCPNANKRMSCISQLAALPALFGKAQKPAGFEFVSWAEVQKCFMSSRGWMARKWSTIKWLSPLPGRITWSRLKTDKIPHPPPLSFSVSLILCVHRCVGVRTCVRDSDTERQTDTDRQSALTHTLMTTDCSLRGYQGWSWRPSWYIMAYFWSLTLDCSIWGSTKCLLKCEPTIFLASLRALVLSLVWCRYCWDLAYYINRSF